MTGIKRLRERADGYVRDGREVDASVLKDIADQIERETLPRPLFEDGTPVQVGDGFIDRDGTACVAQSISVFEVEDCLLDGTLYDADRGKFVTVNLNFLERVKRPEPEVLDTDGVPIKVGDEVWGSGREQHAYKVLSVAIKRADGRFTVKCTDLDDDGEEVLCDASLLTHKCPEPPDTWERLTAEVEACDGSACQYFKKDHDPKNHSCEGCKAAESGKDCMVQAMDEVLRRCKALAGVE